MSEDVRSRLQSGSCCIGAWIQIASPDHAGLLALWPWDWIAIDLEHGNVSVNDLAPLINAIKARKPSIPIYVRSASHDHSALRKILENPVDGIIVPDVRSVEQLRKIKKTIFLPPRGAAGVGYCPVNDYGLNFKDYSQRNSQIFFVPMIENIAALDCVDSIISESYVDAIFIGPYDLSASMGQMGIFDSRFEFVMQELQKKCKNKGVPVGRHIIEPSKAKLQNAIDDGFQFLAYSTDAQIFINGLQGAFK